MERPSRSSWSPWIGPGLGAFVACASVALRALQLTGDSLNELRAISSEVHPPPHPHHLLFAPIVGAFHRVLRVLHPACDAQLAAQVHNALWAGLSTMAAYWILERELASRRAAVPWALALAASAGYATCATQIEAYVPAAGCLLLVTALLLRGPIGPAWTLVASALFALAVLYHQSAVLFAVPLVLAVRRGERVRAQPGRRWIRAAGLLLVASGVLVLAAYREASGEASPGGVLRFATEYARHPDPAWASWSNVSLTGAGRLLRSQMQSLVHLPHPSPFVERALVGAFAVLLAGLASLALAEVRRSRRTLAALLFPLTWLGAHWGFFLWFLPRESDHFVITVFPLLLLAALVLEAAARSPALRRAGLAVGIVVLAAGAAWNTLDITLPRHRDRGPEHREAAALARLGLVERSLVLCEWGVGVQLTHFFDARATADASLVLQAFYEGAPEPALPAGTERVVVPVSVLLPGFRVGPSSGRTRAERWLAFLRWLGACHPGHGDEPATHASLALARTDSGARYLVFDRSRSVAGDLTALLAALDRLAGGAEPVFTLTGATFARDAR